MAFIGSEAWQLRYQRNNKQSGLKNIRPDEKAVRFTVSFGEFALKDAATIRVGNIISADDIIENERVDDLFKPWHRGEVQNGGVIIFNKQKKGWHYSWVSNKHTSDSEHVFRVYLFEQASENTFRCLATYDSPPFTIFCRRRDKSGVERLPPQFQNAVSSRSSNSDESEEDEEEDERPKRKKREPAPTTKRTKALASISRASSQSSAASSSLAPSTAKSNITHEHAVIFRILAALTNVHDRQQQQLEANGPASSHGKSAASVTSSIPNPATPSTNEESDDPDGDLFDISKAISDCWDWVSPDENFTDTQFFDSFFSQPSAKPVEETLLRLGQHLLKEDFSREIEDVFANKATGGDESKREVIRCLREKFESFFVKEGTSLEKFDRDLLAQSPQLAEEKTKSIQLLFPPAASTRLAFHNPVPMENLFRPPFRIVPNGPHDFTGHWRRPSSTLETLEKLRSVIGFSWIERKLMLQMEQEFFIWYEGNTMFVRGQRKLAGSNTLIHVIDGMDYPFVQPSAMLGDNTPSIGLFNRTWATDDGRMHFCTTYTTEYRTIRSTRRSPDGNRLDSTITLQRNESCQLPGVWIDVCSFPVLAERITSY